MTRWALGETADKGFYAFISAATQHTEQDSEPEQPGYQERDSEPEQQAAYDDLTGLPRQEMLTQRLVQELAASADSGHRLALFVVDIDNFERVNSFMGNQVGDQTLVTIARKLRAAVKAVDMVARVSGDTFAIACANVQTQDNAVAIATRLLDALADPLRIDAYTVRISASMGVAVSTEDDNQESLLAATNAALRDAQGSGGGQYALRYDPAAPEAPARLPVQTELKQALKLDQLQLYFEPVLDTNEQLKAVEAQIRWAHPDRGLLPASEFMPIAQQHGLAPQIAEWALEQAPRHAETLARERAGQPPLVLLLRLSAQNLDQGALVTAFQHLISQSTGQVRFGLAFSEPAALEDPETAAQTLARLNELGVMLCLDGFGTGGATLAHLKRFPLDGLKLDRTFVTDIADNAVDRGIAEAVISLAHALGIQVIAGGVDTREQAQTLGKTGVDLVQGVFHGSPQPLDELLQTSFFQPTQPAVE